MTEGEQPQTERGDSDRDECKNTACHWMRLAVNWIKERPFNEKLRFVFDLLLVIATTVYAVASVKGCEASRQELAAYVSFDEMSSPTGIVKTDKPPAASTSLGTDPKPPLYELEVKGLLHNSGKTPAQQVRFVLKYMSHDYGSTLDVSACPERKNAPASPEAFIPAGVRQPGSPLPLVLDRHTAQLIKDKTKALYLYGCISYMDIFKQRRCTELCDIYNPDTGEFTFCPHFNVLDECDANYTD